MTAHSGALAGSRAGWEALADATGMLLVSDLAELTDTLELLAIGHARGTVRHRDRPRSGAERSLVADLADELAVPFAPLSAATVDRLTDLLEPGVAPATRSTCGAAARTPGSSSAPRFARWRTTRRCPSSPSPSTSSRSTTATRRTRTRCSTCGPMRCAPRRAGQRPSAVDRRPRPGCARPASRCWRAPAAVSSRCAICSRWRAPRPNHRRRADRHARQRQWSARLAAARAAHRGRVVRAAGGVRHPGGGGARGGRRVVCRHGGPRHRLPRRPEDRRRGGGAQVGRRRRRARSRRRGGRCGPPIATSPAGSVRAVLVCAQAAAGRRARPRDHPRPAARAAGRRGGRRHARRTAARPGGDAAAGIPAARPRPARATPAASTVRRLAGGATGGRRTDRRRDRRPRRARPGTRGRAGRRWTSIR